MDLKDLKYRLKENKSKVIMGIGIIAFILVVIGILKIFGVNLNYGFKDSGAESEKYILAEGLIGGNVNGEVNLYNIKKSEITDTINLNGSTYIYDNGSDMKSISAYNSDEDTITIIKIKKDKLIKERAKKVSLGENKILNYDYKNEALLGLMKDEKRLIYKNLNDKKEIVIDLNLKNNIDNYILLDKVVLFTSGDRIYNFDLKTKKSNNIDIGEVTSSIHETNGKVFIHNNFGFERSKSILIDINPETLYINSVYEFKDSKVNILQTSSESKKIYYSEEFLTSTKDKIKQVVKNIGEDLKNPVSSFKYVGEYSISKLNSYGNLGYVYYREKDTVKIYNLKNLQNEYNVKLIDDFYMPIY